MSRGDGALAVLRRAVLAAAGRDQGTVSSPSVEDFRSLSGDVVRRELEALLLSPHPERGLERLNADGALDIADAIYLLGYLFGNGPDPESPFGDCGVDPTPEDPELGCESYPLCEGQ